MTIPGDFNSKNKDSIIESLNVPNQPARSVVNPDQTDIFDKLFNGEDWITLRFLTEERWENSGVITASQLIATGEGRFKGIWVSAASATPTIKLWDYTAASTLVLVDTFTPVAATMYTWPVHKFFTGLYLTIGGTVSCNIYYNINV